MESGLRSIPGLYLTNFLLPRLEQSYKDLLRRMPKPHSPEIGSGTSNTRLPSPSSLHIITHWGWRSSSMGRMSDLEKMAREKLRFNGAVTMIPVPKPQLAMQGLGVNPAVTSTAEDLSRHVIKYAASVRLEDYVFLHEFSQVKLNEIGFRKAETIVESKAAECCSSESESAQMRVARVIVGETLVDAILYRVFLKESEVLRNQLDYSFLMTRNLRNIERGLGLQAVSQAAGYRVSKRQSGLGDNDALGRAIHEAFGNGETTKNYEKVFGVLSRLPQVGSAEGIEQLDDAKVMVIVDCILELFEIQTGKRCA